MKFKFVNFIKKEKRIVIVIFVLISLLTTFKIISGVVINMSASITPGVYILYPKIAIKKGDIINFNIPHEVKILSLERNYMTKKITSLTKYVVALEGDIVERKNNQILINNIPTGTIYLTDKNNRPLNSVLLEGEKLVLTKGEYFTMGITENSLDSRYYGIIKEKDIVKKAKLIMPFSEIDRVKKSPD